MRSIRMVFICAALATCLPTGNAQNAARNKRFGAREGEVITPPARSERHQDSLGEGDAAPDFTLADPAGKSEFKLSEYRGKRPVVLVFGSFTCPPFRRRVLDVDKLFEEFKDRVEFRFVYIREAHPDSVLFVKEGERESLQKIEQTETLDERGQHAKLCTETLKLAMPAVVDKADNAVNKTFAAWPIRLVIVDTEGKLAHISGPGPAGFNPSEVAAWLKSNVK
ncbi:MAG TPA: deiodinase-like protein [Pirellulaceae bacterium]|nr:deiodinase-like protein [Pirellulaceae bacterium]